MNRRITNMIRFLMDECLPPWIRDSKFFMWPFYVLAYGRLDVSFIMNFKRHVYKMSDDQLSEFYKRLNSVSRRRETDMSELSLKAVIEHVPADARHFLDAGCGNGYLLRKIQEQYPDLELNGLDYKPFSDCGRINLREGCVTNMPYALGSMDVVVCTHTLEHVIDLRLAISELKRVVNRRLIVVVPRQRYFYYTLDEHIHFFMSQYELAHLFEVDSSKVYNFDGDWLVVWDKN